MHINHRRDWLKSSAVLAIALGMAYPAFAQTASGSADSPDQTAADPSVISDIIVTGSSIRGAPPVGSNLISVNREAIEETSIQTVQQLLKTVPAVTGLGSAGQGAFGSLDAAGANAPTIHGLGGVSSNSTLIVIDGHRFPLSGVIRSLGDPNILPPNAIERVEVVADGASSIYGSDAVAGVINFVTRRRFEGIEVNGQLGFGKNYRTRNASLTAGQRWDTGFAFFAYNYSDRDALAERDRSFTRRNHIPDGGTNFSNFNCGPATFQPTGSSLIYQAPYTSPGVSNAQANAMCDETGVTDLIPSEKRHAMMAKVEQEFGDRLTLSTDVVYSIRRNVQNISRGSVTARVFGPGNANASQINPFYVFPTGVTATSGLVRFNADELLGPGAKAYSEAETFYATGNIQYRLSDSWRLSGMVMAGVNTSSITNIGQLCTSCALLALNGTTNTNGVLTQPSIIGTNTIVLNVPLTAANALDVFNPAATNRTSAAVLAQLTDSNNFQRARQDIQQYIVKVDGDLFSLPAGEVKVAVGGEYVKYGASPELAQPLNTGPASTGSRYLNLKYSRDVKSAFAEALVPIVSEDMDISFIRTLDLNISGRYDKYSDFGSTTNPKVGLNWQVVEGVKVRGNIARSFVAPPIGTIGQDGMSLDTNFGARSGQFEVPLDRYPDARLIPGCATATTTCTFGTAAIPGMQINGANPDLKAQKGKTWSIGLDLAPVATPGLTASFTFWHNNFRGGVTSPIPALALNSTGFANLLTIYPNGATPDEIAAFQGYRPQSTVLAETVYFGFDFRNQNALNLTVEGIDADVRYRHRFDWGTLRGGVAATYKTRFDQQVGDNSPTFSVLNRNRFNSTFPSLRLDLRGDIGFDVGPVSGAVFVNHTGGYTFWGDSAVNPITTSGGAPTGGGDKVKSYTTVDLNLGYSFEGILPGNVRAFVDVTNLFDRAPPFINVATGYDNFVSNPIGRVVTFGLRTKF